MLDDDSEEVVDYLKQLQADRQKQLHKEAEKPEKEANPAWFSMHMALAAKRALSSVGSEFGCPMIPSQNLFRLKLYGSEWSDSKLLQDRVKYQ